MHTSRSDLRSGPRLLGPAVASALAVGALVVWPPAKAAIVILTLLGCVAVLLFAKPLRFEPGAPREGPPPEGTPLVKAPCSVLNLRLPRMLYYGGMLFLAQLTFRPLGFTVSDYFFFASLLATGAAYLGNRRPIPLVLPTTMLVGVLVYTIGALLSSVVAASPLASAAIASRFVYLTVVWFWLGTVVLQRPSHLRTAIRLWVFSAAITGAAALLQFFFGNVIPGTSIASGRMTGFSQHVNDLGGVTSIALVPAVMLASGIRMRMASRILSYIPPTLIATGLMLSGAVGGMIAATSASLIWLSFSTRRHRALIMLFVAMIGLAVISEAQRGAGSQSPIDRLNAVSASRDDPGATLFSRFDTIEGAWVSIRANPFLGVGLDQESNKVEATGFPVHNLVIGPWYEAGLLGILGMIVVLSSLVTLARRTVSRSRSQDEWTVALSLYAAFGGLLVLGTGAPVLFQRYGWVAAALLIAIRAQQRRSSKPHAPSMAIRSSLATGMG